MKAPRLSSLGLVTFALEVLVLGHCGSRVWGNRGLLTI